MKEGQNADAVVHEILLSRTHDLHHDAEILRIDDASKNLNQQATTQISSELAMMADVLLLWLL